MRILQINAVYGFGSTGRNVQEMHEWFIHNGNESFVACSQFGKSLPNNSYKIGNIVDRKIHALLSRIFDAQGRFSYIATYMLIRYIKKIKPDIIHLHNYHSNYLNYVSLLSFVAKMDIPIVVTLHDCFPFTGHCFHFEECRKWVGESCKFCDAKNNLVPSFNIVDGAYKSYLIKEKAWKKIPRIGVIGVSKWVTDQCKLSMLGYLKNIETIYNWVDTSVFNTSRNSRVDLKCKAQYLLVAVATSWSNEKGIDDLYALMKILGNDYHLIVVGKCENKRININNVTFYGRTKDANELAEIYATADVFVNPSHMETFGKVTVEAIACGTPAVVYNVTACPELVPETCGKVVDKSDIKALAASVIEICNNGKSMYKESCEKFIDDNFTLDKSARNHISFYSKIICGD